jgi:Transcriptional regulators
MTTVGKRATLKTVAAAAGVSTATVSYVLSGRNGATIGVTEATASKVRDAASRLNYRPNRAARAVRTGRTGTVLLSLHMLSDPWSLAVVEAMNEAGNRRDLTTMILADGDWYSALERQECDVAYLENIADDPDAHEKIASLVANGQRLVIFDEQLEAEGFDVIRSRAVPGSRLAVEHLLETHTAVGCLTSRRARYADGESRYTAYTGALAAHGIPVRDDYVREFEDVQASAFAAATSLLDSPDRPAAVYATADFAAIAAINAAHRLGLRVPQDVAIIGVGNIPGGGGVTPALSSVGPDESFYPRLAQIIVARAMGEGEPAVHEFPWRLEVRASSDPAAGIRQPAAGAHEASGGHDQRGTA